MHNPFRTFVAAALLLAPAALAQSTTKLSASASGTNGNGPSALGTSPDTLSPDGRFAVFASNSSNLVTADTNLLLDVFLRDTVTGTVTRASVASGGLETNADSLSPAVSDDGRFIAFQSLASNLASGDFNSTWDVFVHDRQTGLTTIVSVANSGAIGNGASTNPSISGDGTLIAFASDATNLAVSDPNGATDVFVRNLTTNSTRMVSRVPGGALGNAASKAPALSGDGRYVAFESLATNLAPGATAAFSKILVIDLNAGGPQLASVNSLGLAADAGSTQPSLSSDGSRIAFMSTASNLATVPAATNNAFLRDRTAGTTTLVNALPNGTPANGATSAVRLADNGAFAVLLSTSSNLTPGHSGTVADAFVVDLTTGLSLRASVPLTVPGEPNGTGIQSVGGVSDDGRLATFQSASTNLLVGDPNDSVGDVYLRDSLTNWYRDVDGDTWGNSADSLAVIFPPTAGYSLVPGDCNDSNPAVNPGAVETCNGVDDDCDGSTDELAWSSYCAAGTSVAGCLPTITATGFPSAANASGFFLQASGLPGGKQAIAVYGLAPTAVAYAFGSTSTICVASPRARTLNLPTGGSAGQCNGGYSLDWLAFMAANPSTLGQPIQPGQTFYAQVWYRDAGVVLNSNLTAGVAFTLCP
ncbi:MAG: PD40 domain-containing protein [Planctomycetaceae bacterium]|nr:PD40 domain-containing protein [Planctomycetaceae bacterium]